MARKIIILCVFIVCCLYSFGQDSNSSAILESVSRFVPSERVFVHTDRDYYRRGDTIWYRAFLQSEGTVGVSNFVYVDLIDDEQNVVSRHKVRRKNDQFYSQIPVELSFRPGGYTLRAYTYWMLNFDKQTYFYKPIFITSDNLTAEVKEKQSETKPQNITTIIGGDKLTIKATSKGDQHLTVYNSNALFVLQPLTKAEEFFAIDLKDLPSGEIVAAILDSRGRVIERSIEMINPITHTPQIDISKTEVGDSTLIRLYVSAPEGDYSLSLAHGDLCAPFVDIRSLLKNGSTIDIENALMGKAQNMGRYIELEQSLVGYVKNIRDKKLAKGFQISVSLGSLDELYVSDVDRSGLFRVDLSDVTGGQRLMCKLMEPRGTSVLDCVIESESTLFPKGNSPYRFVNKPKVETKAAYSKSPEPETERVINIDSIIVKGTTYRRPYVPFTMVQGMAQYNRVGNREVHIPEPMEERTLYEILHLKRMLPKFRERSNPEYMAKSRSVISRRGTAAAGVSEDIGWKKWSDVDLSKGQGSILMMEANDTKAPASSRRELLPDDWLWMYIIDGMECSPDEGMFQSLYGRDILTIQIIHNPNFFFVDCDMVIAIETKTTETGRPRTPNRNFAAISYVGYTVPVDFVYQSRNTIGWKPDLRVGRKPVTVEFLVPTDAVRGNYAVTLNGVTASGEPITSQIELAL